MYARGGSLTLTNVLQYVVATRNTHHTTSLYSAITHFNHIHVLSGDVSTRPRTDYFRCSNSNLRFGFDLIIVKTELARWPTSVLASCGVWDQ